MTSRVIFLLITISFSHFLLSQQVFAQVVLDHEMKTLFNQKNKVECLISFNSSASIPNYRGLSKEEKGELVYTILQDNAQKAQQKTKNYLSSQGVEYQAYCVANAIYTIINKEQAKTIAGFEDVNKIQFNPTTRLEELEIVNEDIASRGPSNAPEWNVALINADKVWNMGYRGEGVVIGGADTGVDWRNPLITNKYRGNQPNSMFHGYNWHDAIASINPLHEDATIDEETNPCGLRIMAPCDDQGHGSHTIGTMVGEDGGNQIGIAPEARWIACRNMERGYGSPATYIDCFEWFLAPTNRLGEHPAPHLAPDVINNSWSCPEMEGCNSSNWNLIEEAINNMKAAGIFVTVSAGNSGPDCGTISTPPAMFSNSFAVGASDINDNLGSFSARGPVMVNGSGILKPDVVAPGVNVRSIVLNNEFQSWSGTSMAGPHVAGVVALIISANPSLKGNVETIENIIRDTAIPMTDSQSCGNVSGMSIPNNSFGYGRIDALAAVERALITVSTQDVISNSGLQIFPNPVESYFEIRTEEYMQGEFQLMDIHGKKLLSKEINTQNKNTISTANLDSGSYIYHFRTSEGVIVGKIIKAN